MRWTSSVRPLIAFPLFMLQGLISHPAQAACVFDTSNYGDRRV